MKCSFEHFFPAGGGKLLKRDAFLMLMQFLFADATETELATFAPGPKSGEGGLNVHPKFVFNPFCAVLALPARSFQHGKHFSAGEMRVVVGAWPKLAKSCQSGSFSFTHGSVADLALQACNLDDPLSHAEAMCTYPCAARSRM